VGQPRILLLCERGGFAPLHQAASAAASALATGARVDLVLFHGALARVLDDAVDEVGLDVPDPGSYREALDSGRVAPVSQVLEGAREAGLGLYACSASVALLGREPDEVLARVDEVVGWPTIHGWAARADRVLSL
jgi:predicted peroxiredoxin